MRKRGRTIPPLGLLMVDVKEAFERLQKGIAMIQEAMGEAHHARQ